MASYSMERKDRFFLPVNKEVFLWYSMGKAWEVRNLKGRFNKKNISIDKTIEIRMGYNGESLWGKIEDVKTFGSYNYLFEIISYKKVLPSCDSLEEAMDIMASYTNTSQNLIAIQIKLHNVIADKLTLHFSNCPSSARGLPLLGKRQRLSMNDQ